MDRQSIKVGISACLLGEKVRFDGGHKVSRFVEKELSPHFEFIKVCPEVGIGMPVPRPTIRLISDDERVALVETKDESKDYTQKMTDYSKAKTTHLAKQDLCGYIVCAKSPTCGMERVKIYKKHSASKEGVGLFTKELMASMPWLPVEEDGRLNDPILKENFISRVFALSDFYESMDGAPTPGKIVAFHSRYKLTLMAHNQDAYKTLGQLVANVKQIPEDEFYVEYRNTLMEALTERASRKNNANVLMHAQGYFKKMLSSVERQQFRKVIDEYRLGTLPLLSAITMVNHYLTLYPNEYLSSQVFLNPHPHELRLRYAL
jgi:uncharacterized protein YbgA (DUF1722 family)/uncharacterized protein YbbK (DUF523 family)